MITLAYDNIDTYQYIPMFKKTSLSVLITNKSQIPYKVDNTTKYKKQKLYFKTLNHKKSAYICYLNDQDYHNHHTIGIDCRTQYIYDVSLGEYMTLSRQNLDRCCGDRCFFTNFSNIALMSQL